MSEIDTVKKVVRSVEQAAGLIRDIFGVAFGHEKVIPYIDLGFVGISYLRKLLESDWSEQNVMGVLSLSPKELWDNAQDVERTVALIKRTQIARVKQRNK